MSTSEAARQLAAIKRLVVFLTRTFSGLDADRALEILISINASKLRALYELDGWLTEHPDALTNPGSHFPVALQRLADYLYDNGYLDVTVPVCGACGRRMRPLVMSPGGRICGTCHARNRIGVCVRCGKTKRIMGRRADGRICGQCRNQEQDLWRTCIQCGRLKPPAYRRADGQPLCHTCRPLPVRTCTRCGNNAPTHYNGINGALCAPCYKKHKQPTGRCAKCGDDTTIADRDGSGEAICYRCYRRPIFDSQCAVCGRMRPCYRQGRTKTMMCRNCLPAPIVKCSRCAQLRPVTVNWPMGPVCRRCYQATLCHPSKCSACGQQRHLIARDTSSDVTVCGPCAGSEYQYTCRACHTDGLIFAQGLCVRCLAHQRMQDLLTGPDGTVAAQFQPLLDVIKTSRNPISVLRWLHDSPTVRLLTAFAATGQPATHEAIDVLMPPSLSEFYARNLLVHAGVLPPRLEYLERIQTWLHHLLQQQPPHYSKLLRPFVIWHLLRRARRNAHRQGTNSATAQALRARILLTLKLLRWIDNQGLSLATLTQDQLDQWFLAGPPHRHRAASFINWANDRGLTTTAASEQVPRSRSAAVLPEHERWQQIQRCLTDTTMPLEARVGGALVLLYGLTADRILSLTQKQVTQHNDRTFIHIGRRPLLLPPSLAALVHQLRQQPTTRSGIAAPPAGPAAYLFPGVVAGQHLQPAGFYRVLLNHGIAISTARPAALIALTSELPPPIVADILGIHVGTAQQWADYQRSDWATYLASRSQSQHDRRNTPDSK